MDSAVCGSYLSGIHKVMRIALFDFDGTITRNDTFISFGMKARGKSGFFRAVLSSLPWLIGWKLNVISNSKAKEHLFGCLFRNMSVEEFQSNCESFKTDIDKNLREDTLRLIRHHQDAGDKVVIVSASIADWIRPWASANGIDTVIATEIEVLPSGTISGKFSSRNCHGQEKVNRIKETLHPSSDDEIRAYGDSSGDKEMLAFANHAQIM